MFIQKMRLTTIRRYLGALDTLYKEWIGKQEITDTHVPFSSILGKYADDDVSEQLQNIEKNAKVIEHLISLAISLRGVDHMFNMAFQYLLFNPKASLPDIATLTFSAQVPDCPHIEDILLSMRNTPQAKYVFPLSQGKRRQPAIVRDLLIDLHAAGRRAGLCFGNSFSRESITAIWIHAAIQSGIKLTEILSIVRNLPVEYSFLSLLTPAAVTPERENDIICHVADSISNKTIRWFVMRLRSGVSPDDIKNRLKEQKNPYLSQTQFYYPLRCVKRLEKKRVVTEETPYLPGILFFRIAADKVSRLMSGLGEWAWCYRTTANSTSPYSAISQNEMRTFQRCIGAFTDDIEFELVSALPTLKVGDEVIIEDGGQLSGRQATIRKVRSIDGSVTYTLRLSETTYIRWQDINLPASHLTKL